MLPVSLFEREQLPFPASRSPAEASLHTLQHQRKSFAGGPNFSTCSQKAEPASTSSREISISRQKRLTNSTVSGNSIPVLRKKALSSLCFMEARARSSTTRLSFPPLKET